MKKLPKILLRIFFALLFLSLLWIVFNFSLFTYGLGQLEGQLHIVLNARPMKEVLDDNTVPDSVKQKIQFIETVKKYAIDSIGLKPSENYTTFYDQGNKPLLWVLTVSEPFKLKAYEWKFPLLGIVSYKGFFNYNNAKDEELTMKLQGYDTDLGEVSAWSTLGWFRDPILSNMIYRSKGQIAELIIHELTHSTIYLKSNVNLNENLASVCGEQGAIRFLKSAYGEKSDELNDYLNRKEDYDRFSRQMLIGTHKLDSLYSIMNDSLVILKLASKAKLINEIIHSLDTVSFHSKTRYKNIFTKRFPNNAYFLDFIRYDAAKEEMKEELTKKFSGDIRKYIEYLRQKH